MLWHHPIQRANTIPRSSHSTSAERNDAIFTANRSHHSNEMEWNGRLCGASHWTSKQLGIKAAEQMKWRSIWFWEHFLPRENAKGGERRRYMVKIRFISGRAIRWAFLPHSRQFLFSSLPMASTTQQWKSWTDRERIREERGFYADLCWKRLLASNNRKW